MELKLNIYKNQREIEKTYTVEEYDLMLGPVEDLLNELDLEALVSKSDRDSLITAASRLLKSRKDVIYPLLKDVFEGLTDDELRKTKVKELLTVVAGIAGFRPETIEQFTKSAGK